MAQHTDAVQALAEASSPMLGWLIAIGEWAIALAVVVFVVRRGWSEFLFYMGWGGYGGTFGRPSGRHSR